MPPPPTDEFAKLREEVAGLEAELKRVREREESAGLTGSSPVGEALLDRIHQLEEGLKERETSLFHALKVLVADWVAYQKGDREKLPEAALMGVVSAYLRPRVVLILGSILAAIMASLQVVLLLQQNTYINQQNQYIQEQARSNRLEAIQSVLAGIEPTSESAPISLAMAQLASLRPEGVEVLLQLAEIRPSPTQSSRSMVMGRAARRGLVVSAESLEEAERASALVAMMKAYSYFARGVLELEYATDLSEDQKQLVDYARGHELQTLNRFFQRLPDAASLAPHLPSGFERTVAEFYAMLASSWGVMIAGDLAYTLTSTTGPIDQGLSRICQRISGVHDPESRSLLRVFREEEGEVSSSMPHMARRSLYPTVLGERCSVPQPTTPKATEFGARP